MNHKSGWNGIILRNDWFQKWVSRKILSLNSKNLFSYSYTARLPFYEAKKKKMSCILGQIDPGPLEFDHVKELNTRYLHLAQINSTPPMSYWDSWREEIKLADKIIINSSWSSQFLIKSGVPSKKLVEIPLSYYSNKKPNLKNKIVNKLFSASDPLKVLFLGSLNLRKGIGHALDAVLLLKHAPVKFTFAGPIYIDIPRVFLQMDNVEFLGAVDKDTANKLYSDSDIFLFPTISDGFGLTQLEALSNGLPIITSANCANVITNKWNGIVLEDITPENIADSVMYLISNPDHLLFMEENAFVPDKYHPRHLSRMLEKLSSQMN